MSISDSGLISRTRKGKDLYFLVTPPSPAQATRRNLGSWGPSVISPVSDEDTALVSMLSVTTLRVQRLNTRPGIRKQKWRLLDISTWQSNGQSQAERRCYKARWQPSVRYHPKCFTVEEAGEEE